MDSLPGKANIEALVELYSYKVNDLAQGKYPLGVFYINPKPTFEENLAVYRENEVPVYKRKKDLEKVSQKLFSFI